MSFLFKYSESSVEKLAKPELFHHIKSRDILKKFFVFFSLINTHAEIFLSCLSKKFLSVCRQFLVLEF